MDDEELIDQIDSALGGRTPSPLTPLQVKLLMPLSDGRWHCFWTIAEDVMPKRPNDQHEYFCEAINKHNRGFATNSPLPPGVLIGLRNMKSGGTQVRAVPRERLKETGVEQAERTRKLVEEWQLQLATKKKEKKKR